MFSSHRLLVYSPPRRKTSSGKFGYRNYCWRWTWMSSRLVVVDTGLFGTAVVGIEDFVDVTLRGWLWNRKHGKTTAKDTRFQYYIISILHSVRCGTTLSNLWWHIYDKNDDEESSRSKDTSTAILSKTNIRIVRRWKSSSFYRCMQYRWRQPKIFEYVVRFDYNSRRTNFRKLL